MNQQYNQVPNIITGKDLDYLSDMFQWNIGAFKASTHFKKEVQDVEIQTIFEEANALFHSNIISVLDILGGNNE